MSNAAPPSPDWNPHEAADRPLVAPRPPPTRIVYESVPGVPAGTPGDVIVSTSRMYPVPVAFPDTSNTALTTTEPYSTWLVALPLELAPPVAEPARLMVPGWVTKWS